MPILVKVCRIGPDDGPNDEASGRRRTVSTGRRLAQPKLSQGSSGPFPLHLNPKLRLFDPKSSYFSQFKPRNIIKTHLSQIIKSKIQKLEAVKGEKSQDLSIFFRGFLYQVCGISLVGSFRPLGP